MTIETTETYRRQLRMRMRLAFLEGLGLTPTATLVRALALAESDPVREPEAIAPIPLSRDERIALHALRLLVERGVIRGAAS